MRSAIVLLAGALLAACLPAFAAEPVRELPDARLDEGIVRALWLAPEALRGMASRHRSPLVWRAVADYLGGSRHPLDLVRHLA